MKNFCAKNIRKSADVSGKKRNSTVELFRVVLMLMVITLHYLYNGGVLKKLPYGSANYMLSWGIEALCLVAVNCYVMISAWFLSAKAADWRKAAAIFCQVLFYSIGTTSPFASWANSIFTG